MDRFKYITRTLTGCLIMILSVALLPSTLLAQNNPSIGVSSDIDAETTDRFTESDAIRLITNKDETVDLAVTDSGVAIQFSDKFLENLEDGIKNSEEETGEASAFADAIRSMVGSGVRTLLDHAILIPYFEIGSVSYSEGRIIITDVNGKDMLEDLEINDKQVMDDFSRRDARRLVDDAEKRLI